MKFLTTNFVQCAVKSCARSSDSFPLSYAGVELVQQEVDFDPDFIVNILPKIEWNALLTVAKELGNESLPAVKPEIDDPESEDSQALMKDLHSLLLETQITEGQLTCRSCGHIYQVKAGIPNFLLPPHLA